MQIEQRIKPSTLLSGGLLSLSCISFSAAQEPSSASRELVSKTPITQPELPSPQNELTTDQATTLSTTLPRLPDVPAEYNVQPNILSPLKDYQPEYYQNEVSFLRTEPTENDIALKFVFNSRPSTRFPDKSLDEVELTIPKSEGQNIDLILLTLKERGFSLKEISLAPIVEREKSSLKVEPDSQLKINDKDKSSLKTLAGQIGFWSKTLSYALVASVAAFKLYQVWRMRNLRDKAIKANEAEIIKRRERDNAEDSAEVQSTDLNSMNIHDQALLSVHTSGRQISKLDYTIRGAAQPTVTISLPPGGLIFAESGAMLRYDSRIQMTTLSGKVLGMSQAPTGFLKRYLAGESLFVQSYTNDTTSPLSLTLAPSRLGEMLHIDLSDFPEGLIADQGAFFAATSRVQLDLINKGGLKGVLSGMGMFQQKFSGKGDLFLFSAGSLERVEVQEGESFKVDSDALFLWEPSVNVSLTRQSLGEAAVSGEGLFTGTISGHGSVWLASRGSGDDASSNKMGGILNKAEWLFRILSN